MSELKLTQNDLYLINHTGDNIDLDASFIREPFERYELSINGSTELIVGDYYCCERMSVHIVIKGENLEYRLGKLDKKEVK